MTVPRLIAAVAALLALLFGAGCGDRDRAALPAETDETFYVHGMQLKKVDRYSEALTAFLKVIARRGEAGAPESHLEAAQIYLNHTKDPFEAIHHFKKYLELQPNSKQAPGVRGMVEAARREIWKTLPSRSNEDQSARLQQEEEIARLRRENSELRAEIATLRGGASSFARSTPVITLPDPNRPRAEPPVTHVGSSSLPIATPNRPAAAPVQPASPSSRGPASVAPAPARGQSAPPAATRGRTHTVAPQEGLWAIARKHYGTANAANVQGIRDANPTVNTDALSPGTVLRIP
jgi:tetratricopeptide (TPR) repeat protein